MNLIIKGIWVTAMCSVFFTYAEVKLPKLLSDGMILQRNEPIKIWGTSAVGEEITIQFLEQTFKTISSNKGQWDITLPPMSHGGPYEMSIKGENEIVLKDILIGDVWLASGQSNMAFTMSKVSELYAQEITNSSNQFIRQFKVPKTIQFNRPKADFFSGQWEFASPNSVAGFSAVAYFFAKQIYENYGVPVGIINSSVGGTPAQAWTSSESIKQIPEYFFRTEQLKLDGFIEGIEKATQSANKIWNESANDNDEGLINKWYNKNLDDSDWDTMNCPGQWQKKGTSAQGVLWLRKHIELNSTNISDATLKLGRFVDADAVYINGKLLGKTAHKFLHRKYDVPQSLLHEGINTIAVRLVTYRGKPAMLNGAEYSFRLKDTLIPLEGLWKAKKGFSIQALPKPHNFSWEPTVLYNGMIAPLKDYKLKGAIWYQGEGNVRKAVQYDSLFPIMINDWRKQFNQELPFLFVQLANYLKPVDQPESSAWARLREAQLKTLELPKTGMAVIIDVGEAYDIHPRNKKAVGYRLALEADRIVYNQNTRPSPVLKSLKIKGDTVILCFNKKASKLLKKGDDPLKYFSISAADKQFKWANAKIVGKYRVKVWNSKISNPKAVRYAWADNPEEVNFYTTNNRPISPFRTDDWEK